MKNMFAERAVNKDSGVPATAPNKKVRPAWQPLTARGVAAFAYASLSRLLLVQFVVALVAAGSVVWFVHRAWFPTISQAIQQLPKQGELRSGRLYWAGDSPVCLASGRFLAVVVDLDHAGTARVPAHLQVEFGLTDFNVYFYSLFSLTRVVYPPGWNAAFNQAELGPWWGAWAPAILAIVGASVVAGLLVIWGCLATVYFLPIWLAGLFLRRELSLGGSWHLAGAALMPGALLMCLAVIFYGWGMLDPVHMVMIGAVHFVMGWVYLVAGPLCLPRHTTAGMAKENPFA
jgi:hypothetical protein